MVLSLEEKMSPDRRMLEALGVANVDELFADIPQGMREGTLEIADGRSEMQVTRDVAGMLGKNITSSDMPSFLGCGCYQHFVPAAVRSLVTRSEFLTSYTPYQAEISQGMLQALFEYQSMIAELTGMDVANSSNYDISTALGEAALMAYRIRPGRCFLVPEAMSWERKSVLRNYLRGIGLDVKEYSYDPYTGDADLGDIAAKAGPSTSGIYAETPNLFGKVDPGIARLKREFPEAVLVVGADPVSLGLLTPPGEYGADIAIGEGQGLGAGMNFGGPMLGIFAARAEHVRKMPGRLIGMTRDPAGERAFCMTLQTREQHIRRAKATSNICTNEALTALTAAAYLAVVGGRGLRNIAKANVAGCRALMEAVDALDGYRVEFDGCHFNEFAMRCPVRPEKLNLLLLRHGVIGGVPLGRHVPRMHEHMLLATTEVHDQADRDKLVAALAEVA
jgi:glycine dehydrogenase subunit 1